MSDPHRRSDSSLDGASSMKCTACGNENQPGAKFCVHCGIVLSAMTPAAPAQAPSAVPPSSTATAQRPVTPPPSPPSTMQRPEAPPPPTPAAQTGTRPAYVTSSPPAASTASASAAPPAAGQPTAESAAA